MKIRYARMSDEELQKVIGAAVQKRERRILFWTIVILSGIGGGFILHALWVHFSR